MTGRSGRAHAPMAPEYIEAVTTDPQLDTVFFGRFAVTMKKR